MLVITNIYITLRKKKKQIELLLDIESIIKEDKKSGFVFHLFDNLGLSNYINKNSYMNSAIISTYNKIKDNKINSILDYQNLDYITILKHLEYQVKNYNQEIKEQQEKIDIEVRINEKLIIVDEKTKLLKGKILQHEFLKIFDKIKKVFSKEKKRKKSKIKSIKIIGDLYVIRSCNRRFIWRRI
jgi:hypothetical protein